MLMRHHMTFYDYRPSSLCSFRESESSSPGLVTSLCPIVFAVVQRAFEKSLVKLLRKLFLLWLFVSQSNQEFVCYTTEQTQARGKARVESPAVGFNPGVTSQVALVQSQGLFRRHLRNATTVVQKDRHWYRIVLFQLLLQLLRTGLRASLTEGSVVGPGKSGSVRWGLPLLSRP